MPGRVSNRASAIVDNSSDTKTSPPLPTTIETAGTSKDFLPDLPATDDLNVNIWQLPPPSEGAILDALFIEIIYSDAASTRLMHYLTYSLVTGIVSQRAVLSTCRKWVPTIPPDNVCVVEALAFFLARIIPYYRFTTVGQDVRTEVIEFLFAFLLVVKSASRSPAVSTELANMLIHDRVIALVRACARREPNIWQKLHPALSQLTVQPKSNEQGVAPSLPSQSAVDVAPYLTPLVSKLTHGLALGVIPFDTIGASVGIAVSIPDNADVSSVLQTILTVSNRVFGTEATVALRELWSQREGSHGDLSHLIELERGAKVPSLSSQSSSAVKQMVKTNVQACESVVRLLAARASVQGASDKWIWSWGGKDRLKRIIVNALPQIKNEIQSESGALLVAMGVVACAAMCLGPVLRFHDANDGIEPRDEQELALLQKQNEEVEDAVGELTAFAVFSLEQAATAEEVPLWRSFGLWLLFLMSRAGSLLRASGCDYVRAARVLRAWGGMPTGTPGTHAVHSGSGYKHTSQGGGGGGGGHHQVQSSSSSTQADGVTLFAGSASLSIIDVSDVSGGDETLEAICDDLVQ